MVGNVHSVHFSYWWQKPSGYYGVALKQSGWNVTIAGSSLWLSFILVVVKDLTTRYTSGFLLLLMFTSLKVVIIKLILALSSSSDFSLAKLRALAQSVQSWYKCSPCNSTLHSSKLQNLAESKTSFSGQLSRFLGLQKVIKRECQLGIPSRSFSHRQSSMAWGVFVFQSSW